MKHVIRIILVAVIALSACSSDDDPGSNEACQKATEEHEKALDAYAAKVNQHPGPSAAPSVLEAHYAAAKELYDAAEEKRVERNQICGL
jgi:hypothetical protein